MALTIDSHQHFWKFNNEEFSWIDDQMKILKKNFLPQDLFPIIQENNVDGTITVQARQSLEETEWILQLSDENSFIKGVVGWVDLRSKELEKQLERYTQHKKLAGVRHVIQSEPDDKFLLRDDFINGIKSLKKYNLSYDILIYAKHLPQTIEFVNKFPNQIFILDHIAKPDIKNRIIIPWKKNIERLGRFENVYCKLSGMITEADWHSWKPDDLLPYIDVIVKSFGTERLMIGSDWPVCQVAGDYKKVISVVTDYFSKFSEIEKENIFGMNAIKAYGLKL